MLSSDADTGPNAPSHAGPRASTLLTLAGSHVPRTGTYPARGTNMRPNRSYRAITMRAVAGCSPATRSTTV